MIDENGFLTSLDQGVKDINRRMLVQKEKHIRLMMALNGCDDIDNVRIEHGHGCVERLFINDKYIGFYPFPEFKVTDGDNYFFTFTQKFIEADNG